MLLSNNKKERIRFVLFYFSLNLIGGPLVLCVVSIPVGVVVWIIFSTFGSNEPLSVAMFSQLCVVFCVSVFLGIFCNVSPSLFPQE